MGWSSAQNWTTKKDVVDDITQQIIKTGWDIISSASTTQGAYWAVKLQDGSTGIYCAMIQKQRGEFYEKSFFETAGPAMHDCPLKLLETPNTMSDSHGWAAKWREGVRAHHSAKKAPKVDLVGKAIELYGKTYNVFGKRGRSYLASHQGVTYKLGPKHFKHVKVIEPQHATGAV